ncbi:MAG: carbon-nitrogen hydrolase family protein [Saccharolobus sp.]|jgi:predicted amidohydrolase|uniref:carbon-nitrogen hydrolase family protein n=1 Tax=Saccharolobus sp. TaxID=2100761 RepID=UPI0028CF7B2E|nr:carbon-nitrogen hydrolase family protein [Saccharolobus sp.]MDT7860767.1 carbon-nitrogen hydrolase family protein [Saccharolobus sp.]
MLIALTHLRLKELSRKHNIEKAKKLIKQAKDKGAKLVVLPSMFPSGNIFEIYDNDKKLRSYVKNLAEKIPGNNTDILINLAMDGEVHIIVGPILEQAGPKIFLTSLILSPQGEIIGKYRKAVLSEKDIKLGISAGKEPVNVVLDKKYGIIAEDDIFSPEISRLLALGGSDIIIGTMKALGKRQQVIKHIAIARTIENEIPYLIVGESIEDEEGEIIGYSPTFVTSPDNLISKEAEEDDSILLVESSVLMSGNKQLQLTYLEPIINGLCKGIKKIKGESKRKSSQDINVEEE